MELSQKKNIINNHKEFIIEGREKAAELIKN
jgi:hypothetical protein